MLYLCIVFQKSEFILLFNKEKVMNKKKIIGYTKPVFALCLFMLIIYGAYTPSQKAERQQIVCVKFKANTSASEIERYMQEFAQLRSAIPQMVAYSAGKTLAINGKPDYDVMHYVTFRTGEDIETFQNHPKHQAFLKSNEAIFEKTLVINSDIQR